MPIQWKPNNTEYKNANDSIVMNGGSVSNRWEQRGLTVSEINYIKPKNNDMVVKEEESIGWFKRFLRVLSIAFYGYNKMDVQNEYSDEEKEKEKDKLEVEYNNNEYVEKSISRLNILNSYYNEYKLDIVKEVYDYTKIVHDSIIDNKMKPQLLEQFHIYYTDNFLSLFGKIADNNKMRITLLKKRKDKLKSEILKLKEEEKGEFLIINKTQTIKLELKKYDNHIKNVILTNLDKKICFDSIYDTNHYDPFGEEDFIPNEKPKKMNGMGSSGEKSGTSGNGGIIGKSGTSGNGGMSANSGLTIQNTTPVQSFSALQCLWHKDL